MSDKGDIHVYSVFVVVDYEGISVSPNNYVIKDYFESRFI